MLRALRFLYALSTSESPPCHRVVCVSHLVGRSQQSWVEGREGGEGQTVVRCREPERRHVDIGCDPARLQGGRYRRAVTSQHHSGGCNSVTSLVRDERMEMSGQSGVVTELRRDRCPLRISLSLALSLH